MVRYHIDGFQSAGAEIVAIADVNEAAAQRTAASQGIPRVFGDVASLLAEPGIDAVSIIVPNKFHAPLAIQSLQAGKHVFCEKPPAISAGEVEQMIAAAQTVSKTLMFNFNNRARPESFAMMDYIRGGQVGTINSAQAKWIRRTGIPGFGGWFTTKALAGGGPLIDLLHMIDLALFSWDIPSLLMFWAKPSVISSTTNRSRARGGFRMWSVGPRTWRRRPMDSSPSAPARFSAFRYHGRRW